MKITQLSTHTTTHCPGIGMLPNVIEKGKYPDVEFEATPYGVVVTARKCSVLIPWHGIKSAPVAMPSKPQAVANGTANS